MLEKIQAAEAKVLRNKIAMYKFINDVENGKVKLPTVFEKLDDHLVTLSGTDFTLLKELADAAVKADIIGLARQKIASFKLYKLTEEESKDLEGSLQKYVKILESHQEAAKLRLKAYENASANQSKPAKPAAKVAAK